MGIRVRKEDARNVNLAAWVRWVVYAGADLVYVYDTSGSYSRSDKKATDLPGIPELLAAGVLVIVEWKVPNWRKHPMASQLEIYKHCERHYPTSHWRMYLDQDEFVFSTTDFEAGFLRRYLHHVPTNVAVVLLQNTIFGGIDELKKNTSIHMARKPSSPERYLWRT